MKNAIKELETKGRAAKAASHRMAYLSTEVKNKALHNISDDLLAKKDEILSANQIDYKEAEASGMSAAMLDRLMLSSSRLEVIAQDVLAVAANNAIGVLITLEPPTSPMKVEAVDAGYYHSPIYDRDYSKIQILTIDELLHSKTVDMPPANPPFPKAQKIAQKEGEQLSME